MRLLVPATLAVLAVAAGDNTFQTSPASGEFLQTAAGLSVRWQLQPGNSPDSPGVPAPATVSISLGFKDSADKPVVLFPPIGSNVPVSALQFSWNPMNFDSFTNGPVPARTANANWFIVLSDQTTGYKSNGQLFHLVDGGASAGPASSGAVGIASSSIPPGINPTGASTVPSGAPSSTSQAPSALPVSSTTTAARGLTSSNGPSVPTQTPASAASSAAPFRADNIMFLVAAGTSAALLCTR